MSNILINADAVHIPLANKSIQTCVTSPPYWGLRDYGTAEWIGGDLNCDHLGKPVPNRNGFNERYFGNPSSENNKQDALREPFKARCKKCGADRIDNQIGLEQTPEEYIENMVTVFCEVWRVLRDDGTLWLNLGDSYLNKNLMGIPWRVILSLQANGWILRNDNIWHKPNVIPESVRDRCTKSHEYIFLLTKNKKYYYDNEAIKEPAVTKDNNVRDRDKTKLNNTPGRTRSAGLKTNQYAKRNKRTVWKITNKPYKGAHFAVFPPEIPELCIMAGTSEMGQCPKCGAPWRRVTKKKTSFEGGSGKCGRTSEDIHGKWGENRYGKNILLGPVVSTSTIGWDPTCDCGLHPCPQIVLDPFVGSGTTCMVANKLERHSVGIDLSFEYLINNAKIRLEENK